MPLVVVLSTHAVHFMVAIYQYPILASTFTRIKVFIADGETVEMKS